MGIGVGSFGSQLCASLRSLCDLMYITLTFPQALPQGGIDVGIGAEAVGPQLGASLRSLYDLIDATLAFHNIFHGME